jgi:hypothetical protein
LAEKVAAPSVEPGRYDVLVHPSNLWLTIHESIGHATELDRAIGYEANYAGTSFATPEKLNKLANTGFRFQSDIYSLGKVVEWFFDENQNDIAEEQNIQLRKLLSETPAYRPSWQQVLEFLRTLAVSSETESVQVAFRSNLEIDVIGILNSSNPIFNLSHNKPNNSNIDFFIEINLILIVLGFAIVFSPRHAVCRIYGVVVKRFYKNYRLPRPPLAPPDGLGLPP